MNTHCRALVLIIGPFLTLAAQATELEVITLSEQTPESVSRDQAPLQLGNVTYSVGGWVKINAMFSHYTDGDVATPSSGRDYFRPNSIPVSANDGPSSTHFDAHAKDTRVWFQSSATLGELKVATRLEMDFRSSEQGNEIVSNAYSPRLRRAYVTAGKWLVGQEWTLFRNHSGNPESLDSLGATDGLIFGRQPQVRYSTGPWQVSLENSETFLLINGGGARQVTGDSLVPDVHVRYNLKRGWGDMSIAGLVRQLSADQHRTGQDGAAGLVDDDVLGYGVSFAGKLKFSSGDDFRFMLTAGEGIGRYLAIATSADAVVTSNGELEGIPIANGVVSYRHLWSQRLRSTVAVSGLFIDNDTAHTGTSLSQSIMSARVNLIYEPVAKLLVGFELLQAVRDLENGLDGAHTRPQVSLKYSF